ncbi:MAG TPA: beta-N-acetylhexosaminidase [Actinocrinis sp.]|nr:beta-N-acetylhexosaminidase [Actinocrinis sp.]
MIIPRPTEYHPRPGRFSIPPALHLAPGAGAERAADLLAGYLGPGRPRTGDGPAVTLGLDPAPGRLDPEGYSLEITPDAVTLTAPAEAGLFHGVQTLRQLLPPETIVPDQASAESWYWPCVQVTDAPRLPWRGALLDVARHFLPLEFLYEFVDQLALHKLNVLHLHLTDDQGWRIEIDGLPKLTEIGAWRTESMVGPAAKPGRRAGHVDVFDGTPHGGYYTARELRGLVEFADARGVEVVPEIEMPGHARAILAAYPELGNHPDRHLPVWTAWGVSEDILGVQDETLDFCREVLARTIEIFPSRHVHIGGDECPTTQWRDGQVAQARAAQAGLADPAELHGWFLREMHEFLAKQGRRAVAWDEAGESADLPTDLVLTAWRDPSHGVRAVARGNRVIMAPHRSTYLDYPQSTRPEEPVGNPEFIVTLPEVFDFDPLAGGLTAVTGESGGGVLGTQAQLWTEHVATTAHVQYLTYPRLCALAETAWSSGPRDYAEFRERLEGHWRRLRLLGVADSPQALGSTGLTMGEHLAVVAREGGSGGAAGGKPGEQAAAAESMEL